MPKSPLATAISRRKVSLLLLAAALSFGAIRASAQDAVTVTDAKTKVSQVRPFIFNLGASPRTLDPGKATSVDVSVVLRNAFEGLTRPMPDGTVEPAVAESWEVDSTGHIYTFHLRRDARWSNGDPVTAGDFKFTWLRNLEPEFAAEYAYALYPIDGAEEFNTGKIAREDVAIEAPDDHTLVVRLVAPAPYWVSFLDHSTYLPVHPATVEANENWSLKPETYISNGPYKIDEIDPKQRLVLHPNPHHRSFEEIGLREIVFRMIVDASTALLEFRNGRIHGIINAPPVADIPTLRDEGILQNIGQLGTYFICFNTRVAPFDNKEVRRAFTLAINRGLLAKLLKTGVVPAMAFVPPGIRLPDGEDFRETYGDYFRDGDFVRAKKILEDAGYPDGKGLPQITYVYNTNDGHKIVGEFVQNAWKQVLGVNARLQNVEWKVLNDARHQGNFQVARHGWIGDYRDPLTFLDMWISTSGNNDAQWHNETYDELIDLARFETDPAERMELFAEAEQLLMDEFVVCPIYFYTMNYYESEDVEGIERSIVSTIRFDRAKWVD